MFGQRDCGVVLECLLVMTRSLSLWVSLKKASTCSWYRKAEWVHVMQYNVQLEAKLIKEVLQLVIG